MKLQANKKCFQLDKMSHAEASSNVKIHKFEIWNTFKHSVLGFLYNDSI